MNQDPVLGRDGTGRREVREVSWGMHRKYNQLQLHSEARPPPAPSPALAGARVTAPGRGQQLASCAGLRALSHVPLQALAT